MRRLLIVILLTLLSSGCALLPEVEDETKDWSASQFYSEAKEALAEGEYEQAIKYYEGLEARYPFGRYAEQAQLEIGYAYHKHEEPEQAIAAAERFIKLHPRHAHVDYAYYLKGLVNFNRGQGLVERYLAQDPAERDPSALRQSLADFSELVRRFPNSAYAADAKQRVQFLRNSLAEHELFVADYYLRRGAYLAAANRAKEVVERYPNTPAVERALQVMIEAYTQLGLADMAKDARRVYELNYGGASRAAQP